MKKKDREIYTDVYNAEDRIITITAISCKFYGERTTKRIIASKSVGYKVIEDYVWEEAYNTKGVFGGYACVDIIKTMKKVGV